MLKTLLGGLFGKDPTEGWPPHSGGQPTFDLEMLAVGSLRLGAAFEGARSVGKPSRWREPTRGALVLEYAPVAMELRFHDRKLVCAGFYTAADAIERFGAGSKPCEPTIGGHRVTGQTTPDEVLARFGPPVSDGGSPAGLRWIEYQRGSATLEFEFDEGLLGFVQIYAEGYA